MTSANAPTLGTTYQITGCELPPLSAGYLVIGSTCYQNPIALGVPFLPGCWQHQNWIAFVPVVSDGCGRLLLPVALPNNNALIGTHVFLQDLHRRGSLFQFDTTNSTEVRFYNLQGLVPGMRIRAGHGFACHGLATGRRRQPTPVHVRSTGCLRHRTNPIDPKPASLPAPAGASARIMLHE